MRAKYIIAIIVILAFMAILFYKDRPQHPLENPENSDASDTSDSAAAPVEAKNNSDKPNQPAKDPKEKSNVAADEQVAEIQKNFSASLKQMGTCLGVPTTTDSDKISPSFEALIGSLRSGLGEMVVRMDDWSQQDLRFPDGSVKRVRTEVEYTDSGTPLKRVQLYKISEQGMPELQQLDPAQSNDPSDEFINSLKGEGQATGDEKGGRAYFQEGEELVVVERNGKVQSFSISKGEKTFSCTETDASTSNCQCLQ